MQHWMPGLLLAALMAGCAQPAATSADDPLPELPAQPVTIFEGELAWPIEPSSIEAFHVDVPDASELVLYFNWRGQQPGGYSSMRQAVVVAPDGTKTEILGGDLPANPYVCASTACGPADDRRFSFASPLPGTWTLELRGAYTATASLRAEIMPA